MNELEPVGEDFFARAPVCVARVQRLPCTPAALFESLSGVDDWKVWVDLEVTWTSPRPFGVGTTRSIVMPGVRADERFFVWEDERLEDGGRFAFTLTRSNLPMIRSIAEDYRIRPLPEGGCELSWTMALEGRGLVRLLHPVLRLAIGAVTARNLKRLERLMASRA